ncbi:AAA family ATPase [Clavibacter michiganensis]|uniref:AAA family ATPase n=1 Tax=Clavibacter michiganensis TaxID=28447 RepID=UPI003EBAEDEB
MHIAKLSLVNYRNFSATHLDFEKGVNTVIGENGTGKTNIFRAIRLLLDSNLLSSAYRLGLEDFNRSLGDWRGHWIIISLEFDALSEDETIQALFLHGSSVIDNAAVTRASYNLIFRPRLHIRQQLAELSAGDMSGLADLRDQIHLTDYETIFTGRSTADFANERWYASAIGDFDNGIFPKELENPTIGVALPKQLSVAREVSFSFVPALRDVARDFKDNRPNPLRNLLWSKSGQIEPNDFSEVTDKVVALNDAIEQWPDVEDVTADIKATLGGAVGDAYSPSSMRIRSNLPADADRLFQSLKLFVGEDESAYEGSIDELSLGGANLLYLSLKLLEFKYSQASQPIANFLLIEEPEAHVHTHIQNALFDRLNFDSTQIIYSTHSTHVSQVSNIRRMNVLGRDAGTVRAYQPSTGLSESAVNKLQRYLDAVRSNLLFARSVILVEGDAEELLIPTLVKQALGVSLDELGISLVNVRGTGFENIASVFHDRRIHKRCAILTDRDAVLEVIPKSEKDAERVKWREAMERSASDGASREARLNAFAAGNDWIRVFYTQHTFEVDVLGSGNRNAIVALVDEVWSRNTVKEKAVTALRSDVVSTYGPAVLSMANKFGKGWFALSLSASIGNDAAIPDYISQALRFVHPVFSVGVWTQIFTYRLNVYSKDEPTEVDPYKTLRRAISEYRIGGQSFDQLLSAARIAIPNDNIHTFVATYTS